MDGALAMTHKTVWQPKPPKMTSKAKVAYIVEETKASKGAAIDALQANGWRLRAAIEALGGARQPPSSTDTQP